jgi:hypothetical protein
MPKKIENALKKSGRKKNLSGERLNAYVYGSLRKKFGWKPKREKKSYGS